MKKLFLGLLTTSIFVAILFATRSQPQQPVAAPTPVVITPKPVVITPKPVVITPKPVVITPTPVVAPPTPLVRIPAQIDAEPAPAPPVVVLPEAEVPELSPLKNLEAVNVPPQKKEIPEEPPYETSLNAWLGAGFNYQRFSQNSPETFGNATFSKLVAPTTALGLNLRLSDSHAFNLEYHELPGAIASSASLTTDKKSYLWKSAILEHEWKLHKGNKTNYSLLLGTELHYLPFLNLSSPGNVSVLENELTKYLVGGKVTYQHSESVTYEILMRYQATGSSRSSDRYTFSSEGGTSFDGSLGVLKKMKSGRTVGIYWFGQSHSFNYSFKNDSTTTTGSQNLINSNIQLRFGTDLFSDP